MSSSARFYLRLTPEQLLEYYHGQKQFVRVQTLEGFSIQFRAEHLRRWVTHVGIDGVFEIRFDDQNRFVDLRLLTSGAGGSGGGGGGGGGGGRAGGGGPTRRPGGFIGSA